MTRGLNASGASLVRNHERQASVLYRYEMHAVCVLSAFGSHQGIVVDSTVTSSRHGCISGVRWTVHACLPVYP